MEKIRAKGNPNGICERCGAQIMYMDLYCRNCGMENYNWIVPDENHCGNCHNTLEKDDLFCRICGTKRGDGEFLPYQNIMQCIYGPMPVRREHKCKTCGYYWENCVMVDYDKYCPKCGRDLSGHGFSWDIF